MGMHFGLLAVGAPWDPAFAAISRMTGDFIPRGEVGPGDEPHLDSTDDGFLILAGGLMDRSYILDTSMLLSGGEYDRLVALSSELECTVGAVLAETVSGTFSLLIAEKGTVERLYFNCHSSISQPYSVGSPLPSEAVTPLEDIDGRGLFAALDSIGFRTIEWQSRSPRHRYLYTCRELEAESGPPAGPLAQQLDQHHRAFAIPKHLVPRPKVVSRKLPDGSVAFDILPGKPSVLARLRSLLKM